MKNVAGVPWRAALASALCALGLGGEAVGGPRTVAAQPEGLGLGWGWQSDREAAVPSVCIEFSRGENLAQTSRLTISEVSDRAELMDKLDIGASLSVEAIGGRASASASFAKSVEIKQTSSTFLLRAEVDDGLIFTAPPDAGGPMRTNAGPPAAPEPAESERRRGGWLESIFGRGRPEDDAAAPQDREAALPPPGSVRLTPRARALIASGRKDDFFRECGDSFVWGIRGGAELSAAITFRTRSLAEKETVAAEMSGSYSFVRGTGTFRKDHDAAQTAETYTMTSLQVGGSEGAIPASREALLDKLAGLAKEAAGRPKPVGLLVSYYHELPGWPAGPLSAGGSTIDERLAAYWRYTTLYENIQEVLDNPAAFMLNRGVTLTSLRTLQDQVSDIRRTIEAAAETVQARERAQGGLALQAEDLPVERLVAALNAPAEAASPDRPEASGAGGEDDGKAEDTLPESPLYDALAAVEQQMVPIEELLTQMPLPYADPAQKPEDRLSDADMQRAIVDYYIARTAKRRCAIAASDPGCLSNEEIAGFVVQVPTGDSDLTRHGNPVGYGDGRRFGDAPIYSVLDSRVTGIAIHYNRFGIVGLDIGYRTSDGRNVTIGSGKPKGAETGSLDLAEDERITAMTGRWLPLYVPKRSTRAAMDFRHILELRFRTDKDRMLGHRGAFADAAPVKSLARAFSFESEEGEELFALSGRLNDLRLSGIGGPRLTLLGALEPVYRKTP